MNILKELYFNESAAKERAEELASNIKGEVQSRAVLDLNEEISYSEIDSYSGETSAYMVVDEFGDTYAVIGYWI